MLSNRLKLSSHTLFDRKREELEQSDFELVMQVREHSRRALEILYARYSGKAMGLAFQILHDRDLADEVVVDAFWRVWQRADQFEVTRGSFSSWLYGIVRHLAIDELRRREARPVPGTDEQLELVSLADDTDARDVTELVARNFQADTVHHALRTLPDAQRQVLELAYFEGLTRKEISRKLGQPIGTIHTRARLGLDKLRTILVTQG